MTHVVVLVLSLFLILGMGFSSEVEGEAQPWARRWFSGRAFGTSAAIVVGSKVACFATARATAIGQGLRVADGHGSSELDGSMKRTETNQTLAQNVGEEVLALVVVLILLLIRVLARKTMVCHIPTYILGQFPRSRYRGLEPTWHDKLISGANRTKRAKSEAGDSGPGVTQHRDRVPAVCSRPWIKDETSPCPTRDRHHALAHPDDMTWQSGIACGSL